MNNIENFLLEDYKRYLQLESDLYDELNTLPSGCVYKKRVNGKIYYVNEYTINGKRYSRNIPKEDIDIYTQATEQRKYIKEELALIAKYKRFITDKIPEITLLSHLEPQYLPVKSLQINTNDPILQYPAAYRTLKGDLVRSKSEIIIANGLFTCGKKYIYEKRLNLDSYIFHPDFTIYREDASVTYWEHCGMMNIQDYIDKWNWKKSIYMKNGIFEWKNLIVTYENDDNLIDAVKIDNIIKLLL